MGSSRDSQRARTPRYLWRCPRRMQYDKGDDRVFCGGEDDGMRKPDFRSLRELAKAVSETDAAFQGIYNDKDMQEKNK